MKHCVNVAFSVIVPSLGRNETLCKCRLLFDCAQLWPYRPSGPEGLPGEGHQSHSHQRPLHRPAVHGELRETLRHCPSLKANTMLFTSADTAAGHFCCAADKKCNVTDKEKGTVRLKLNYSALD